MTYEEIIAGNNLIAEFMEDTLIYNDTIGNYAKYHANWNSLMTVVEKIGSNEDFKRQIDLSIEYFYSGDIHSVWLAVIEFIKQYNQNK